MLPHYEYWAFNPMEPRPSLGNRLKQLMATYKVSDYLLLYCVYYIVLQLINLKILNNMISLLYLLYNGDPCYISYKNILCVYVLF